MPNTELAHCIRDLKAHQEAKKKGGPKPPFLLIDADVLVYQACAGVEKIVLWEEDVCLPVANLSDAYASFEFKLNFIMETLGSQDVLLCFSDDGGNNFRKRIFPAYKSNRVGKPRPVALKFLREQILSDLIYPTMLLPTLEADDVIGILATDPSYKPDQEKIIVTIDKDLKSIPCSFFNIKHPEDGVQKVTQEEADTWFMTQTLIGDSTDGYSGCPKYGPVAAAKALNPLDKTIEAMWPVVVEAYEKAGLGEDHALAMARLARILHHEDYNQETRKVKLWEPL